jgi:hypothetical protein
VLIHALFETTLFKNISKRMKTKICLSIFLLILSKVICLGQQRSLTSQPTSKRFIERIELIIGPSVQLPDDNGFSDKLKEASMGTILHTFNSRYGYSFGLGVKQLLGERIEINSRFLWEQKGFIEEKKSTSPNSTDFTFYRGDLKSNYFTLSISPIFYLSKERRIQVYPGIYYSWLQNSFRKEELYNNNQLTFSGSTSNDPNLKNDYGILVGGGYSIPISSKINLTIRLQFNYGIAKIMDVNSLQINNNTISLFTVFSFRKQTLNN